MSLEVSRLHVIVLHYTHEGNEKLKTLFSQNVLVGGAHGTCIVCSL